MRVKLETLLGHACSKSAFLFQAHRVKHPIAAGLLFAALGFLHQPLVSANEYPPRTNTPEDVAIIDFVKGYAIVQPREQHDNALFAKRGMEILQRDLLITGDNGFVSLSFSNGTAVRIQPSSKVLAERLNCVADSPNCQITFKVMQGNINSSVEGRAGEDIEFTIKTPYASAAVRGTVFDIDVQDGRLLAGVTEGSVSVNADAGTVELPESFGTKVENNQPPSTPKPLLSAPEFQSGPARFESGGEIGWTTLALANQYQIALNNSEGLVYSTKSDETLHKLRPLTVGTYAMSVRAIDEEGFLGITAERDLDVVITDASRAGPVIKSMLQDNEFSVMVEPQARIGKQVELQFSMSDDFDLLSTIDVPLGELASASRANNSIFVRARGVLSNERVTLFGPIMEIPAIGVQAK